MISIDVIKSLAKWDGNSMEFTGQFITVEPSKRRVVGFYDNKNLLHLLVESEEKSFEAIMRNGMSAELRTVELRDGSAFCGVDFVCNQIGFDEYFLKIINEILKESARLDNVEQVTPRVIENWFHFLEKPRKPCLDFNKIVGLIGELKTIETLYELKYEPQNILEFWTGPDSGKRDFMFGDFDIEVKTSAKQEGHIHRINGLDQLTIIGEEVIYLFSWNIKKEHSEQAFNLAGLINEIESDIFVNLAERVQFRDKLYLEGYDVRNEDDYEKWRFSVKGSKFLMVNEQFPRICQTSFVNPLDDRILRVEYDIDLNGMDSLDLTTISSHVH